MDWMLVGIVVGFLVGVWVTMFAKKIKPSGTFVIDCTDAFKDVCRIELDENLNMIYEKKEIVLRVKTVGDFTQI